MNMHSKIGVLRQIAQGMGYLHAKGIVLRKLNTKNVFIGESGAGGKECVWVWGGRGEGDSVMGFYFLLLSYLRMC